MVISKKTSAVAAKTTTTSTTSTASTAAPAKKRTANAAFMKPLQVSAKLQAVVNAASLPRTEVVKKVWEYIKKHDLQDKTNKRMINADAKLKEVFAGKAQVSMFEMTKLLSAHLS
jgi:upstream activation factor subunit UAF30